MTTFILTVIGVTGLAMTSALPLFYALSDAVTGYEDPGGFHVGVLTSAVGNDHAPALAPIPLAGGAVVKAGGVAEPSSFGVLTVKR